MKNSIVVFLTIGIFLTGCSPEVQKKAGQFFDGTGNLVKAAGHEVSNNWQTAPKDEIAPDSPTHEEPKKDEIKKEEVKIVTPPRGSHY